MDHKPYNSFEIYQLLFNDDLALTGEYSSRLNDYAAYEVRKDIRQHDSIPQYVEKLESNMPNLKILNLSVEGLDSIHTSLNLSYDVAYGIDLSSPEELVYYSPVINPYFKKNPFTLEDREYPVELPYPIQIQQMYYFSIPEGYEVLEVPRPAVVRLPDNSASFIYQSGITDDVVNVTLSLFINRSLFVHEEYASLKQFLQIITDKQKELVVLKKS